jgi:tetratricopeptide (TPR) repeat protein
MHSIRAALLVLVLGCFPCMRSAAGQDAPPDAAERQLRAAIRLNPEAAALHASLAEALRLQGRVAEALESHRTAVRLAPDSAEYRARLAALLLEARQWERAELQFRQAIRMDSTRADLYAGLGEALRRQGLRLPAREAFGRAVRLEPGNAEFQRLLEEAEGEEPDGAATGPPLRLVRLVFVVLFAAVLALAGVAMVLPVLAAAYLLLVVAPLALLRGARR